MGQTEGGRVDGGIFISYRREDSAGYARLIYDRIVNRVDRDHVFFDVDNIEPGLDFVSILSERVGACDSLVAVIGRQWLTVRDDQQRRRIDDPQDFVRIEIEAALKRDIRVIPVLVDGARMPRPEELPDGLKSLSKRQAIEISHTRFDADAENLTRWLRRLEEQRLKLAEAEAARKAELERAESERLERQKQTEARRQAEERIRQAEAARLAAEEALRARLAEEARRQEEERLRQAEAEAARKAELERVERERLERQKQDEARRQAEERTRQAEAARPPTLESPPARPIAGASPAASQGAAAGLARRREEGVGAARPNRRVALAASILGLAGAVAIGVAVVKTMAPREPVVSSSVAYAPSTPTPAPSQPPVAAPTASPAPTRAAETPAPAAAAATAVVAAAPTAVVASPAPAAAAKTPTAVPPATASTSAPPTPAAETAAAVSTPPAPTPAASPATPLAAPQQPAAPQPAVAQAQADQAIWARVRAEADADAIREFLARYPDSPHAPDAKALLDVLDRVAAEKAAEAERQRLADAQRAEDAKKAEEAQKAAEAQKAEEARKAEEVQKAAEAQKAEEAQKAIEAQKAAAAAEAAKVALASPAAPEVEPTSAKPDPRALVLPIQAELRRIGCYAGGDSDWGSVPMQLSVVKYALYAKLAATPAAPDEALLESLKGQRGRICPLECPANETAVDGRCVAKSCAAGEVMGRDGACQKRPVAARIVAPRKAAPAAAPAPAKGHCFNFNGSQYCE